MGEKYSPIVIMFVASMCFCLIPAHATYTYPYLYVQISPTCPTMDLNQQYVSFTALVCGGTPPYTYQWVLNGANVSGATGSSTPAPDGYAFFSWNFTPTSLGTYYVNVTVTDYANEVEGSINVPTVTVNSPLFVSVSPSTLMMDVNQSKTFTATACNGTPPYYYQWELDGSNIDGANSSNYTFTPLSTGSFNITCVVWDSTELNWKVLFPSSTASVTVNAASTPDPVHAFWLLRYLKVEASDKGLFRPWSCHQTIPV